MEKEKDFYAAIENQDIAKLKSLLVSDSSLDFHYGDSFTPLIGAIKKQNIEMVNLLIANGANVNYTAKSGKSPLAFAVETENPDVIEILLSNDAKSEVAQNKANNLLDFKLLIKNKELFDKLFLKGFEFSTKSLKIQTITGGICAAIGFIWLFKSLINIPVQSIEFYGANILIFIGLFISIKANTKSQILEHRTDLLDENGEIKKHDINVDANDNPTIYFHSIISTAIFWLINTLFYIYILSDFMSRKRIYDNILLFLPLASFFSFIALLIVAFNAKKKSDGSLLITLSIVGSIIIEAITIIFMFK